MITFDEKTLTQQVETGKLTAGLIIPPEFSRNLTQEKTASIQVFIDGVDANTAGIAKGYINQIVQNSAREKLIKVGHFPSQHK
jgi:ABC-2 type transport system permease protein